MNAHEFNKYELGIDLNNLYIPIEKEIIDMLDAKNDEWIMNPLKKLTMCKLVMWGSRMLQVH